LLAYMYLSIIERTIYLELSGVVDQTKIFRGSD